VIHTSRNQTRFKVTVKYDPYADAPVDVPNVDPYDPYAESQGTENVQTTAPSCAPYDETTKGTGNGQNVDSSQQTQDPSQQTQNQDGQTQNQGGQTQNQGGATQDEVSTQGQSNATDSSQNGSSSTGQDGTSVVVDGTEVSNTDGSQTQDQSNTQGGSTGTNTDTNTSTGDQTNQNGTTQGAQDNTSTGDQSNENGTTQDAQDNTSTGDQSNENGTTQTSTGGQSSQNGTSPGAQDGTPNSNTDDDQTAAANQDDQVQNTDDPTSSATTDDSVNVDNGSIIGLFNLTASRFSLAAACLAAQQGDVYTTDQTLFVPYVYYLATDADDPFSVVGTVEEAVHKYLTEELILKRCPKSRRQLVVDTADPEDLDSIRGCGTGTTNKLKNCDSPDATKTCYVMEGVSVVFLESGYLVKDNEALYDYIAFLISQIGLSDDSIGTVDFQDIPVPSFPAETGEPTPVDTTVTSRESKNSVSLAGIFIAAFVAIGVAAASGIFVARKQRAAKFSTDHGVQLDEDYRQPQVEKPLSRKASLVYHIRTHDEMLEDSSLASTYVIGAEGIHNDVVLQPLPTKFMKGRSPSTPVTYIMSPRAYTTPDTVQL
jgi:hypothetical protein